MNLVLIGSGGHCGVVLDAVNKLGEFQVVAILDNIHAGKIRHGYQVERIEGWEHAFAFIAIGDNKVREDLYRADRNYISVFHPTAQVSGSCGYGTYLGANSVVGNGSKVGNFSIVNTACILEHNSTVGDFTHIAPGVITGGNVKIGSRTFIGLGSKIRDGITIGNNCIIGAGSLVLKDVPDNSTWYGVPAKFVRVNK